MENAGSHQQWSQRRLQDTGLRRNGSMRADAATPKRTRVCACSGRLWRPRCLWRLTSVEWNTAKRCGDLDLRFGIRTDFCCLKSVDLSRDLPLDAFDCNLLTGICLLSLPFSPPLLPLILLNGSFSFRRALESERRSAFLRTGTAKIKSKYSTLRPA